MRERQPERKIWAKAPLRLLSYECIFDMSVSRRLFGLKLQLVNKYYMLARDIYMQLNDPGGL
jgi:hypothetical protein